MRYTKDEIWTTLTNGDILNVTDSISQLMISINCDYDTARDILIDHVYNNINKQ